MPDGRLGHPQSHPSLAADGFSGTRHRVVLERCALAFAYEPRARRERVTALARRLEELSRTRRYRLSAAIARPVDALRKLRGRAGDHD